MGICCQVCLSIAGGRLPPVKLVRTRAQSDNLVPAAQDRQSWQLPAPDARIGSIPSGQRVHAVSGGGAGAGPAYEPLGGDDGRHIGLPGAEASAKADASIKARARDEMRLRLHCTCIQSGKIVHTS